jgi:hypothetical protein
MAYAVLKAFAEKKGIVIEKYLEKESILAEYKVKEKVKPLTTEERLMRIEQILGIV